MPEAVIDYPHYPIAVEHLGGDQWRFVLDLSSTAFRRISCIRGRTAIRSACIEKIGLPGTIPGFLGKPERREIAVNDRIVVYDARGKILWVRSLRPWRIPAGPGTVSVKLDYADAGVSEANTLKPEFTVKNTGTVPLKNFRVGYYIRKPEGKSFESARFRLVHAERHAFVPRRIRRRLSALTFDFDEYILYPGESAASGNVACLRIGAPWTRPLGMVIWDENGNVIYGTPWNGDGVCRASKTITFNTKEQ